MPVDSSSRKEGRLQIRFSHIVSTTSFIANEGSAVKSVSIDVGFLAEESFCLSETRGSVGNVEPCRFPLRILMF